MNYEEMKKSEGWLIRLLFIAMFVCAYLSSINPIFGWCTLAGLIILILYFIIRRFAMKEYIISRKLEDNANNWFYRLDYQTKMKFYQGNRNNVKITEIHEMVK